MGSIDAVHPQLACIPEIIDFPNGQRYKRLNTLTDFRKCHDGTPAEARILYLCRLLSDNNDLSGPSPSQGSDDEYVMKIKLQVLGPEGNTSNIPPGPSTTTAAELEALRAFDECKCPHTPHLVAFKHDVQDSNGPLPGGYITYTVMTKMPGRTLLDLKYWSMSVDERDDIKRVFMPVLREVYESGIAPLDRGMRNIMWDQTAQKCSIIDFELWEKPTSTIENETREFQRWGLVHRPPPSTWHAEWGFGSGAVAHEQVDHPAALLLSSE